MWTINKPVRKAYYLGTGNPIALPIAKMGATTIVSPQNSQPTIKGVNGST